MNPKLSLASFTVLLISILILSVDHHYKILSHSGSSNHQWRESLIPIDGGAVGPESLAFDRHGGGPYTGVSDGRIIKWLRNERRWTDFAVTSPRREGCEGSHDHSQTEHICGRPLGLRFNDRTGHLYIADPYMGLLAVGPEGGLATKLATQAQGIPFGFTNSLDIDQRSGTVYFTDSSSRYQRRNYVSAIVSGDNTGRLMKYDPQSKEITVLLNNLTFPNGVALSKDGDFILIADTANCRILKLWLETSQSAAGRGGAEVFTDQLPGFPDNIKRNLKGEFWVGIHAKRGQFLKWVLSYSWVGNALVKLPFDITKVYSFLARWRGCDVAAVRLSEDGDVLEILESKSGKGWKFVSEVEERDGNLWIGSVKMPFVGMQEIGGLSTKLN